MVLTLFNELETSYIRLHKQANYPDVDTFRTQNYFEWTRLKKLCKKYGVEKTYQNYSQIISRNYLKSLMAINICIGMIRGTAVLWGSELTNYYVYDSIIYFAGAVLMCLSVSPFLSSFMTDKYPRLPYIVSTLTPFVMAITDCLPSLMGYIVNKDILRVLNHGYTIAAIYLFMPIEEIHLLAAVGASVSLLYCCNSVLTSCEHAWRVPFLFDLRYFLPDLLFLVGINICGVMFRIRHEFNKRSLFLHRSLNIEERILLKYTKDHEQNLLHTIIPPQISKKIEEDIKIRIEKSEYFKVLTRQVITGRKLFIEPHYNVSILFADVVNYTSLTTKLHIKDLVETLHELFQRFDAACNEFNCMRIKFLGDCYYCVAGVPQSHPFHALCCCELGRSIISHIEEVSAIRELEINMRIGIHSGNIFSGIIGAAKWQYDIWSKDVDIASRLEQTGKPGCVHISEATLILTNGYYVYESGTDRAKNDPFLQNEGVVTYIIKEPSELLTNSTSWKIFTNQYNKLNSISSDFAIIAAQSLFKPTGNSKRYKMDYPALRAKANAEIANKVKSLPVCKLSLIEQCTLGLPQMSAHEMEDYRASLNISVCCLWFENWEWEEKYSKVRNVYFKVTVLGATLILWCVMGMQASNEMSQDNLNTILIFYSILSAYAICILVLAWYRTIYNKFNKYPFLQPRQSISRLLFEISVSLEKSFPARMHAYIVFALSIFAASSVHLMPCDQELLENDDKLMYQFLSGDRRVLCFNAWAVTDSITLCVALIMTYSQLPHCVSFTMSMFIFCGYIVVVFLEFTVVYESSTVTNRSINAEYSHIMNIGSVLFIFQLMNRHLVFLARNDAYTLWNVEKKRRDAYLTNESIKILLNNILPSHVVNVYLSKCLRNEPYYEQHEFLAVMFATVIYARSGSIELRLLNDVICDFDEILEYYKGGIKVEKIKVANWSYIAACGFNALNHKPQHVKRRTGHSEVRALSFLNLYKRQITLSHHPVVVESSESSQSLDLESIRSTELEDYEIQTKQRKKTMIVNVMTHFALDLLRSIRSFNETNQSERGTDEPPIQLRIGISCGEVMAGVVGSSQAHYDIWGNAVNMASRMDSTGEPGRIQVTTDVAEMLTSANITCSYRGLTYVKGRGEVPTYFVDITANMNFAPTNQGLPLSAFDDSFR